MELPAKFIAGISFLSGWPGIILMIVVVPAIVRLSNNQVQILETSKPNER